MPLKPRVRCPPACPAGRWRSSRRAILRMATFDYAAMVLDQGRGPTARAGGMITPKIEAMAA